jgi:hypothetical protein
MTPKSIFHIGLVLFSIGACSRNPLDINPEDISVQLDFVNLDSIFVHTGENELPAQIASLPLQKDGVLAYELGQCLGVGQIADSGTAARIALFVHDPFIQRVEKRIEQHFRKLYIHEKNITNAFKHLKYHFPKGKIPAHIVFMNSFFASNAFCTETEIGIGLERYLGAKTDVIRELPDPIFPWIKEGMDVQFLERDVLASWIYTHYVPEKEDNVADAMIRWGKVIYLTQASLPKLGKHQIIRYSAADYQWAVDNEFSFWKYLVDQKLLFSVRERDKSNFLNDGPFTVGLPEKGPDRLGQFLGWRMVQVYMEANPDTTLEQLINIPYNQILQAYEIEE